jgi:hypothetical protein
MLTNAFETPRPMWQSPNSPEGEAEPRLIQDRNAPQPPHPWAPRLPLLYAWVSKKRIEFGRDSLTIDADLAGLRNWQGFHSRGIYKMPTAPFP